MYCFNLSSIDDAGVDYVTQFAICWGLLGGSLLIAIPVVFFKVKDFGNMQEDLKFSDETFEDVAPAAVLENRTETAVKA